jgi:hypothetical protein
VICRSRPTLRREDARRRYGTALLPEPLTGSSTIFRGERKRVPGEVLFEADRLECLVFLGYDPNFDGAEPPGL